MQNFYFQAHPFKGHVQLCHAREAARRREQCAELRLRDLGLLGQFRNQPPRQLLRTGCRDRSSVPVTFLRPEVNPVSPGFTGICAPGKFLSLARQIRTSFCGFGTHRNPTVTRSALGPNRARGK